VRELEIETRSHRLITEAKLHHLWLEDHATSFEQRHQLGSIFATNLDADASWSIRFMTSEHTKRITIGRGPLRLEREQRRRGEWRARIGIQDGNREHACTHLHSIFDRLRRRRHRLCNPRIDAGRAPRITVDAFDGEAWATTTATSSAIVAAITTAIVAIIAIAIVSAVLIVLIAAAAAAPTTTNWAAATAALGSELSSAATSAATTASHIEIGT
jgi:hypothetical protein